MGVAEWVGGGVAVNVGVIVGVAATTGDAVAVEVACPTIGVGSG